MQGPMEIPPTHIKAYWEQLYDPNGRGGGYTGAGQGWGLSEGRPRGTGGPPTRHEMPGPYVMDDFMDEHKNYQLEIDQKYNEDFQNLPNQVRNEIEQQKNTARNSATTQHSASDQTVTLDAIYSKKAEYQNKVPASLALYNQNPFFLMKELPFKKIYETFRTPSDNPAQALQNAYDTINEAYSSALELKKLSFAMNILAGDLEALAAQRREEENTSRDDSETWLATLANRLSTIDQERDIHISLLPEFLQQRIATETDIPSGTSTKISLDHFKLTVDRIISNASNSVGPYTLPNPGINAP